MPVSTMLSAELLKGLDEHKYSCSGRSITEPAFQVLWNWLVLLMPTWLAPNLITFIGLLCNIFGTGVLFWYSPHLTETAPWWCYASAGISLFVYQSLDAIDGKQARRTGSSSPLGELFDHGCDALSASLLVLGAMATMRMGDHPELVFSILLLTMSMFYSAHWRAYTGGMLEFGLIDVTEAQLAVTLLHLGTAVLGPDTLDVHFLELRLSVIFVFCFQLIGIPFLLNNCRLAFQKRDSGHCRKGTWYTPVVPYVVLIISTASMMVLSPSKISMKEPLLVGLLFACISAQVASSLVVAHMSKTPLDLVAPCLLPMLAVLLNVVLGVPFPEREAVIVALVIAAANLVVTSTLICLQIAAHMGIYIFSIRKRTAE